MLSPGTFLHESRFKYVSLLFVSLTAPKGRWSACSPRVRAGRLLVMFWVSINLKPEVVKEAFDHRILGMVEAFPRSKEELNCVLRDLWVDAPVNGGRDKVIATLSEMGARKCACEASAKCVIGPRPSGSSTFVKATICRYQPMSYHRETASVASKAGGWRSLTPTNPDPYHALPRFPTLALAVVVR